MSEPVFDERIFEGRSEKFREWILREMGEPPPDCKLKEIVPGMFAWVKRTNDTNGDTTD